MTTADAGPSLRDWLISDEGPPEGAWRRALDPILQENTAGPTESADATEDGADGGGPVWDDIPPPGPNQQDSEHPAAPDPLGQQSTADDAGAW